MSTLLTLHRIHVVYLDSRQMSCANEQRLYNALCHASGVFDRSTRLK